MTTIVMSIHNQEKIIGIILNNIFTYSSEDVKEYIFVLDGCTDTSKEILLSKIKNLCRVSYSIIITDNVFETKANNCGLRSVKTKYAIIVQDDMLIMEKNWDKRLLFPIIKYNDVWAVTSRAALNLTINKEYIDVVEGPIGHMYKKEELEKNFPRNEFRIRSIINRGPVAFDMEKLKIMNFFSEELPGLQGFDDVELCLRVRKHNKLWRCGSFWINYYSPLEWGKTRLNSHHSKYMMDEQDKNIDYVIKNYRSEILDTIHETRIINEYQ